MKEIWKDIKGYEGLYQVSNLGKIKNKDNLFLHLNTNTYGYKHVSYDFFNRKIDKYSITRCCNGNRKSAYNYKWRYDNEAF